MLYMNWCVVVFEGAFKTANEKDDFLDVLAGEHLHIAYRRDENQEVVFHMRAMSPREKRRFRNL